MIINEARFHLTIVTWKSTTEFSRVKIQYKIIKFIYYQQKKAILREMIDATKGYHFYYNCFCWLNQNKVVYIKFSYLNSFNEDLQILLQAFQETFHKKKDFLKRMLRTGVHFFLSNYNNLNFAVSLELMG